jgi:hypothetical protein
MVKLYPLNNNKQSGRILNKNILIINSLFIIAITLQKFI